MIDTYSRSMITGADDYPVLGRLIDLQQNIDFSGLRFRERGRTKRRLVKLAGIDIVVSTRVEWSRLRF
jgi:hypothetical protein